MCDYLVEGDAALDGGFRWISCGLPVEGLEAQRTLQGETLRTFFYVFNARFTSFASTRVGSVTGALMVQFNVIF